MLIYQWTNDTKNRYYKITIEGQGNDLVAINYRWGSCITRRGGNKKDLCTREEAKKVIDQMIRRRKSRGYKLVSTLIG